MKKLLLLLLLPTIALAEIVDIAFEPPTAREDGTLMPASEIAGYNVYDNAVQLDPLTLTFGVNTVAVDMSYGKHVITMQTVDTNGRVSVDSVPFTFILNANPRAPKVIGVSRRK